MFNKKFDALGDKKINYSELSDEIKVEISVLGGLDIFTDAHVQGVVNITTKICEAMNMDYPELKKCVLCAYLHDVGKILIPSEILQKNGKLTDEEYAIMKMHTVLGYDICMKYESFKDLAPIVRAHHESPDGSGYPDGLKSEQIPFEADIIKVADVYDALTRKRQYKEGFKQSYAISELAEMASNNKLSATILSYLIEYIMWELNERIEAQVPVIKNHKGDLETLHELESIYKEIYDRGYSPKLAKKLAKYEIEAGYDMSTNANLIIRKQKLLETEEAIYKEAVEEYQKIEESYESVKKYAKLEKWYD